MASAVNDLGLPSQVEYFLPRIGCIIEGGIDHQHFVESDEWYFVRQV